MKRSKDGWQDRVVGRIKPRQRHGEIEAEPEVRQLRGVLRTGKVRRFETALQNLKAEFLVVSPHPRVQDACVFERWGLNRLKAVAAVGLADDGKNRVPSLLLARREIAHTASRGDSHTAILP